MSIKSANHEDFEIAPTKRLKIIRQDRIPIVIPDIFLEVNGVKKPIINYTPFGVAIKSEEDISAKEVIRGAIFLIKNIEAAIVDLKLVRHEKHDDFYECAYEVIGIPINKEHINAINIATMLTEEHTKYVEEIVQIPAEVKVQTYQVKDWMERLEERITQIEGNSNPGEQNSAFEEAFISVVSSYIGASFPMVYNNFQTVIDQFDEETRIKSIEFLREKISGIAYKSPFAQRVYKKPLGYAGDFESMNLIYKNEIVGKTLFEKVLHHYYLHEPSPKAVRNRSEYITARITETLLERKGQKEINILSVACGPSNEWQGLVKSGQFNEYDNVNVYLLDQDVRALQFSQEQVKKLCLEHNCKINFFYINKAIKNLISESGEGEQKYDLIYSAGLFDYLSAPVAKITAKQLYSKLKDKSELIIGNFNVGNPNVAGITIIFDWHLIYRSMDNLRDLFEGVCSDLQIDTEPLNINLFCRLKS
ncbi:MAG: methyltransferase domain-containing protein [Bdellovibrionaceae bacterium]|nr:methyltransferase domain-containing protein [Pseudobdellovibrionaceae bacterium]